MQINRLDKAQPEGRRVQIRMSARQVAKNVSYTLGFFAALAPLLSRAMPLAARVLPTIMSGVQVFTKRFVAVALLLEMDSICTNMVNAIGKGNGLYLAPAFVEGHGMFLKHGSDISDSTGLIMGKNSPFKSIPILGWLL